MGRERASESAGLKVLPPCCSPFLLQVWAVLKYAQWTINSWLSKVERVLKWANWLLSWFLPAAGSSSGGAAADGHQQ